MIGICGAHRTGKTTLAAKFSEDEGMTFVQTRSSAVFEQLGLDPKADYDFETRLVLQNAILHAMCQRFEQMQGHPFITDRTPIDVLAYTMADIQRANLDKRQELMVMSHQHECFKATNRYFRTLLVLQPGIQIKEEVGKAPANIAYMEHLNHLIMGLVVSEYVHCDHFYVPRRYLQLSDRVACVNAAIGKSQQKAAAIAKQREEIGALIH